MTDNAATELPPPAPTSTPLKVRVPNRLGLAALIVSIAGFVGTFVFFGIAASVASLIMALVAVNAHGRRKDTSVWAIAISLLSIAVFVLLVVWVAHLNARQS